MAEYIEREALKETLHKRLLNGNILAWLCGIINEAPTADVAPVVHGRWEIKTDDYDCEYAKCSVCGAEFYDANEDTIDITFNYCPNCGAKMDGE